MQHTYKRQRVGKYILKILQNLGGVASRDKIKEGIVEDEEIKISYSDVFEPVESKSGSSYIPFNYDFNFGIKELYVCGLIEKYRRGEDISLTELGRAIDFSSFPTSEQMEVIEKYWDDKRQAREEKKQVGESNNDEEIDDESIKEEEASDDWKTLVLDRIKQFSPKKFESFSRLLLTNMGIKFDTIKGINMSGDHGIDGFGYFESDEFRTTRVAIQCKRYTEGPVSEPDIDKFKGVMDGFNADYGIFITTSYFTKKAQEKAVLGTKTVTLIDGQKMVELIEKYKLHITPIQTYILDEYYSQKD